MDIEVLASGSSGNAYLVSDGNTMLLLDAGLTIRELRAQSHFRLSDVHAVLISHGHQDHCKAVPGLLKMGMDVYGSRETMEAFRYVPQECILRPHHHVDIGTWTVIPFAVEHDCAGALGYLLYSNKTGEKLLYITDSAYSRYVFPDCTHMMVECNYSADLLHQAVAQGVTDRPLRHRILHTHMSLETMIEFIKACGPERLKQIYLLHMSNEHGDAEEFRRQVQGATGVEVYVA